ncbi:MAG: TIGR04211 family SH3 domain-containing protein [Desulfobulbaceae bacterium]
MPRKSTPPDSARPSFILVSLAMALTLVIILLGGTLATAANWYVKPSAEVPIRSGQGAEFKILAVVPDGMTVELLEEIDPWARVRTPGGTEGWLLKRYLTSEPPLSVTVASLQAENARLKGTDVGRRYDELSAAHSQSEQELSACRAERDEARNNYETLRRDTADVVAIQKRLADATKELQETRAKLLVLEQAKREQRRNTSIMWFVAGGAVMLSGWSLGMMTAKSRKRKTSLY